MRPEARGQETRKGMARRACLPLSTLWEGGRGVRFLSPPVLAFVYCRLSTVYRPLLPQEAPHAPPPCIRNTPYPAGRAGPAPGGVRGRPVGGRAAAALRRPAPRGRRSRRAAVPALRPGRRVAAGRRAPFEGHQPDGGRLRQHRRARRDGPRPAGGAHAGRPDRHHRRFRLRPADGRRPPHLGGRALRPRRALADLGTHSADGPGRVRRDAGPRWDGAHRPGGRPARGRI